ncbi:MAG: K(+)-transporting ATPase subunit F [Comamonadaceae bacterium]|nr:MAG: K(+)-transporting ATPase subunit F [Comamonadaceae bacterium]
MIGLHVLYGFGGACAVALLAYLVHALLRAEDY